MRIRLLSVAALALAMSAAYAQDAPAGPQGQGGGWQGRGGGHGGWGAGHGLMGTVTEATADHFTIKTETGETYTVHFSVNTRVMKQGAQPAGEAGPGEGRFARPEPIKAADIKVGDAIAAMGDVDAAAKSVGAVTVMKIDPERAKQMREMQANYGKTWLMGKVTAIDGVKVTLLGAVDNASHAFVADENTTFRKRREPVTLADVQIGDGVRVEGAVKNGVFVATSVSLMGQPPANMPGPGGAHQPQP